MGNARGADHVYAAALLNGEAMAAQIERAHARDTVLMVCSGSADNFNLEDFYGAGYLVSLLARSSGAHELTDAATAARLLHDRSEAMECLGSSRVGRMMLARGLEHEVKFAAEKSRFSLVARLEGRTLRALRSTADFESPRAATDKRGST